MSRLLLELWTLVRGLVMLIDGKMGKGCLTNLTQHTFTAGYLATRWMVGAGTYLMRLNTRRSHLGSV